MLAALVFLLWIVVALLVVAFLALARQVAVLREKIEPSTPSDEDGPGPGDLAPTLSAPTLDGRIATVGGASSDEQFALLLFVSPDCTKSRKIIPLATILARAEKLRLVLIGNGANTALRTMYSRHKLGGYDFINSEQIPLAYHVADLPSAILVRPDGMIAARKAVSNREQLESVIALA